MQLEFRWAEPVILRRYYIHYSCCILQSFLFPIKFRWTLCLQGFAVAPTYNVTDYLVRVFISWQRISIGRWPTQIRPAIYLLPLSSAILPASWLTWEINLGIALGSFWVGCWRNQYAKFSSFGEGIAWRGKCREEACEAGSFKSFYFIF